MAIRYAANAGNWSALATWDGGASLPGSGDDVYANGKTVTIDQDVTVLSVNTTAGGAAVAGGVFALSAGRTLTANVVAGTTSCVSFGAAGSATITGNITGGNTVSAAGVANTAGGTLNIIGNAVGGSVSNTPGVSNMASGVINMTGNATGGPVGTAHGVTNSVGTFNLTGTCTGGLAGFGANNSSSGTLNVYGEAVGCATANVPGVNNAGSGVCFVQIARGTDYPNGGSTQLTPGTSQAVGGGYITVDAMIFGSGGCVPVSGRHFVRNAGTNYVTMRESNAGPTLNLGELSADYPSVANVRSGTSFDFGNKTGTCHVPAAGSVALGVPVDATTGTAALSPTALLGADLLTRLGTCSTVQTTGDQLAAMGV